MSGGPEEMRSYIDETESTQVPGETGELAENTQTEETGPTPVSTREETNDRIQNLLGPEMLAGTPNEPVEPVRNATSETTPNNEASPFSQPMPAESDNNPAAITDVPEEAEQQKAA